jgi:hypothetical protein
MVERIKRSPNQGKVVLARVVLVFLGVTAPPALAQVDSALGFFPLNNGDLHQFHYHYVYFFCPPPERHAHSSYHIEEVLGDTILPTGFRYRIVRSNVPDDLPRRYLRVDSTSANVYTYSDSPTPHDILVDSLRATVGSSFVREGSQTQCIGVDTTTILALRTIVKRFHVSYIYGEDYSLAYGLGRIASVTYMDDPCYAVRDEHIRDIVFARINGQERGTFVSVAQSGHGLPKTSELEQNYPNPFNPSTTIRYGLPHNSAVRLTVFNTLGQQVATLVQGEQVAGYHEVRFDGAGLSSGVYFYRLTAGNFVQTRKLILLR